MMKTILIFLITLVAVANTQASLMYYTFDGTISNSNVIQNQNVDVFQELSSQLTNGTPVSYTFAIDMGQKGSYNDNGIINYYNDYTSTSETASFIYADFVGTYVLPDMSEIDNNTEYSVGYSFAYANVLDNFSGLLSGQSGHTVEIFRDQLLLGNWQVNQAFIGGESSKTGNGNDGLFTVYSDLILTSITDTLPTLQKNISASVPEPGFVSLIGVSLLFLGGLAISRRKK